jgi:hypothetical protein
MPTAITWGLEASPFLLKLEAMLRFHEVPFRRLPGQGGFLENLRIGGRLERAKRDGTVRRHPEMNRALDEYPAVPFFSEDGVTFQYDSTSLGHWLDDRAASAGASSAGGPDGRASGERLPPLFPTEPRLRFVARLLDEAFDEFGLYMVHHMRWVGSATDTTMGERTADELSRLHHRCSARCPRRASGRAFRAVKYGAARISSAWHPTATRRTSSRCACRRRGRAFRRRTRCCTTRGSRTSTRWRLCSRHSRTSSASASPSPTRARTASCR